MDTFRAVMYAGELAKLTLVFRSALLDAQQDNPGITPAALAQLVADDPDVKSGWAEANDFPRRDYMAFCGEQASRAGVTEDDLRASGDDSSPTQYAVDLLELATEQIGKAADPSASLLPEIPTTISTDPLGCYAVSVVCDSTEPEADKILACALLGATTEHRTAAAGQGRTE